MQGEQSAVRYLFRKGLEVNYRSRYVYLSWGLFERDMGKVENARELFKRGHALNPQDPAILQVRQHACAAETECCAQGKRVHPCFFAHPCMSGLVQHPCSTGGNLAARLTAPQIMIACHLERLCGLEGSATGLPAMIGE